MRKFSLSQFALYLVVHCSVHRCLRKVASNISLFFHGPYWLLLRDHIVIDLTTSTCSKSYHKRVKEQTTPPPKYGTLSFLCSGTKFGKSHHSALLPNPNMELWCFVHFELRNKNGKTCPTPGDFASFGLGNKILKTCPLKIWDFGIL